MFKKSHPDKTMTGAMLQRAHAKRLVKSTADFQPFRWPVIGHPATGVKATITPTTRYADGASRPATSSTGAPYYKRHVMQGTRLSDTPPQFIDQGTSLPAAGTLGVVEAAKFHLKFPSPALGPNYPVRGFPQRAKELITQKMSLLQIAPYQEEPWGSQWDPPLIADVSDHRIRHFTKGRHGVVMRESSGRLHHNLGEW